MDNQKKLPNRLINESSPYLLQHAHNPVDWFPWGNEAFKKARMEDKPVFLSIGYSTCHWCHVMAHESFEDEETAALLNANYISIKVDREERPDIDEVYMNVCQAMTGSGGWPLSIFMTPDRKPFYAGTYFPPRSAYGRVGFPDLLEQISDLWKAEREKIVSQSEKIIALLSQPQSQKTASKDSAALVEKGYRALRQSFDRVHGGFSHAPKFPMAHYLSFLLSYHEAYSDDNALKMTAFTLDAMYRGGIFDQVGYGFSRYSTDERWLVPHFEKMLYDNALLLKAYAQCYAVSGNRLYLDAVNKLCKYVSREMTSPEGAFYSAQDADSEGEEGRFYVWEYEELQRLLTSQELALLEAHYGVSKAGNFEGKNILHRTSTNAEDETASSVLRKLFEIRAQRVPPFKDTKISASWNGLMIEAMAQAGMLLENSAYIEAAARAADFIIERMITQGGSVRGIYGKEGIGFLSDHANIACALQQVYTATREIKYLRGALNVAESMVNRFFEPDESRFYMTAGESEPLFMRPRDEYDGAMPSGAASAMTALSRLYLLTGQPQLKAVLEAAIEGFLLAAEESSASHIHFLSMLLTQCVPHRQIVISSAQDDIHAVNAYQRILSHFMPFTTVICHDRSADMDALFPELAQYQTDKPFAAYICENFACSQPIYSDSELFSRLQM